MYTLPDGQRRKGPVSRLNGTSGPSTPVAARSVPLQTPPSLSERPPFDWQALKENRPIYVTPSKLRKAAAGSTPKAKAPRIYRRQSFLERSKNFLDPSQWWDEVTSLPSHIPLPESRLLGGVIGCTLHLLHAIVAVRSSTAGADDWEAESNSSGLTLLSLLLLVLSVGNVLHLLSSKKVYQMYLARDPVSSANASFATADLSPRSDLQGPTEGSDITLSNGPVSSLIAAWRFLLGLPQPLPDQSNLSRVQQLSVWNPGEGQLALLVVYSPAHAMLYCTIPFAWSNWFLDFTISCLLYLLIVSYEALLRDRAILSSEVLHEYDEKFVYPLINPVKKDASTMTHEAEIVDIWS